MSCKIVSIRHQFASCRGGLDNSRVRIIGETMKLVEFQMSILGEGKEVIGKNSQYRSELCAQGNRQCITFLSGT